MSALAPVIGQPVQYVDYRGRVYGAVIAAITDDGVHLVVFCYLPDMRHDVPPFQLIVRERSCWRPLPTESDDA